MTGRRATVFLMLAAVAAACPTGNLTDHDGGQDVVDNKPATTATEIETHTASTLPTPAAVNPAGGDIASTTPTEDPAATTLPLEDTCYEKYTEYHVYTSFKEENGTTVEYNVTEERENRRCCEGYAFNGLECIIDFCKTLQCSEDPTTRCAVVKRCEAYFPVFVTEQGILSDKCTQPNEAEGHLCTDDTCSAGSVCPGDTSGKAVCLGSSMCDCSPGQVWYLKNLRKASC